MADLETRFKKAVEFVRNSPAGDSSTDHKLSVYALYKQANEGDVTGAQPWAVQLEARAKWDAWKKVEGTSKEAAMEQYIEKLNATNPDWEK
jgi:diazepam-binding inhibitor (GABA receptor modulator, acyl-CoA-binding protein)